MDPTRHQPSRAESDREQSAAAPSLGDIAALFLKLGTTAFGGPAAHVALMQREVVDRRRWLSRNEFLDYLGLTNLIPGPNSTELAIHIGFVQRGWAGFAVAGLSFILPAALLTAALAAAYVRVGTMPEARDLLRALSPVVLVVIAQAIWRLGRTGVTSRVLAAVTVGAIVATVWGAHELLVLGGAAAVVVGARRREPRTVSPLSALAPLATGAAGAPFGLPLLFTTFFKIGAVLFGSGYVLVAFLRADLVQRLGWLTERQLLDAVAAGQMTPGPVFTTATFVGYLLGGGWGATAATVGIFLPAFVFVALTARWIPWLRQSPTARAAIDGVNAAALALMIVVLYQLGRSVLVDPTAIAAAAVSALLIFRYDVNPTWLMIGSGAIGMAASLVG